jgi:hypothetical protein
MDSIGAADMKLRFYLRLSFMLLLASCDRAAIDPSQSLVGAKELPTSHELSREIIEINRGFGGDGFGSHLLSYELRPNNDLAVTHYERSIEKGEIVRGSETFHLSGDIAGRTRRILWRMRPTTLEGVEFETRPTGCERQWDHDFGEFAVVFIKEGEKPGVRDDRVGVFVIPEPESCDNQAAKLSRALVPQIIDRFPKSKVADSFYALKSNS